MRLAAVLVIAGLSTGCGLTVHRGPCPTRVVYQRVEVPVPVPCPVPTIPTKPKLPSESLPADAAWDALVRAIFADRLALAGYARQLEAALRAYIPQPPKPEAKEDKP